MNYHCGVQGEFGLLIYLIYNGYHRGVNIMYIMVRVISHNNVTGHTMHSDTPWVLEAAMTSTITTKPLHVRPGIWLYVYTVIIVISDIHLVPV